MKTEREKRKKKRLKIRFGVDYPKQIAFTANASKDGLHILTGKPFPPGTRLLIEINLPDGQQVIAYGQVSWAKRVPPNLVRLANNAGMGVKLTHFEVGQQALNEYLDNLNY